MKIRDKESNWREIFIENMDDLWYLKNILNKSTVVRKTVLRREEKSEDMERNKESSRKPILISVIPEDIYFQPFTDRLRITGKISEGPEDLVGQHQSLSISQGENVEIFKNNWDKLSLDLFKEALLKNSNNAIFVVMDDETALICFLREYGIQIMAKIYSMKSGKEYANNYSKKNYFLDILKALQSLKYSGNVIITGPGFEGEDFKKYVEENKQKDFKFNHFPSTREDENAIYEIINREEIKKILGESRMGKERKYMERFMEGLGKNSMISYGVEEVNRLSELGNVGVVMVLEESIREGTMEKIMEKTQDSGGEVIIISSEGEYRDTVKNFGGIVALLRYDIQ
jgi:protein pelota